MSDRTTELTELLKRRGYTAFAVRGEEIEILNDQTPPTAEDIGKWLAEPVPEPVRPPSVEEALVAQARAIDVLATAVDAGTITAQDIDAIRAATAMMRQAITELTTKRPG